MPLLMDPVKNTLQGFLMVQPIDKWYDINYIHN